MGRRGEDVVDEAFPSSAVVGENISWNVVENFVVFVEVEPPNDRVRAQA